MRAPLLLAGLIAATLTTAAAPAQAHGHAAGGRTVVQAYPGHWGGPFGAWYGGWQPQVVVMPGQPAQAQPWGGYEGQNLDRESWLRECRRRIGDNGVGGAVISFSVKADQPEQARRRAFHVIDSTRVCSIATNLGDVKSIICHPASTSHGRLSEAQRLAAGVVQGLIRLAVGLEHVPDILADLSRGLDTLA